MAIHKEGYLILLITLILLGIINVAVAQWLPAFSILFIIASVILFLLILQFFRNPTRTIPELDDNILYAPADGEVVVIEETEETEYFKDKRLQISIFMSPLNVHVNRNPVSGQIEYVKYHPGKYLVAWHPKSSTENERTTVVIKNANGTVLLRQIAGAMARRIRNYLSEGQQVLQGTDMGFIKFGSRVDLFLPIDAQVEVKIGDKVTGNKTVVAKYSS
jgi:phosphatidylserine decarboxylase